MKFPTLAATLCALFAAAPLLAADIPQLQDLGADMGRAQRCGAVPAEVLLYSQLAKDLAETAGGEAAYQAFLAAGAAARERQPDNCQAVLTRFDAAMEELYKLNGRSPDQND
jgi:hypothetical protein